MSPAGDDEDGTVLRAGAVTDVGRTRQINQDAPLVAEDLQLWAVADGMGGHQGGEVASELAVTNLRRGYELGQARNVDALLDAAAGANSAVYDASREDPDLAGMGTTLVAIARTDDDELAYVSVGDSRIYLLRDGELSRLTVDHSLVEELVREGAITPEEAKTHPRRNVVTRVLGIEPFVQVDSDVIIPYAGDRYVLCSDGLFNEVEHDTMASVLRRLADPTDAASELVRLANDHGGHDNITVLVLDVVSDDDRAGRASATIGVGPVDDMAGFSVIRASEPAGAEAGTATVTDGATRRARRGTRRAERRAAKRERPRRFTWRVGLFVLVLAAIVGIGLAAVGYYARGTYYVGFDDDGVVTVFQGKPGGVLWFEPTVVERTQFTRDDVRPELVDNLEAGIEVSSLDRAMGFPVTVVATTTTTTTTTPTTTTPGATTTTTP